MTCGLVLLLLWFMGQLAGLRQKRSNKLQAKVNSHLPAQRYSEKHSANKRPPVKTGRAAEATEPHSNGQVEAAERVAEYLGSISNIPPKQLKDHTWLIPQVTLLCRTQVQRALELYRAAVSAGLDLQDVPAENSKKLYAALVTSAIRI